MASKRTTITSCCFLACLAAMPGLHATVLPHHGPVFNVAFSPHGNIAVTGSNSFVRLWDVATGKLLGEPMRHHGQIHSVAFSPDGKRVLSACGDKTAEVGVDDAVHRAVKRLVRLHAAVEQPAPARLLLRLGCSQD